MQFEDIEYYERGGAHPPSLGLYTPGGFWVEKSYFLLVWKLITTSCPTLVWKGEQTTETLCSDPDWNSLDDLPRQKRGRCVKFFIAKEMLELEETNKGKGGKRKFRSPKR